MKFGLAFILTCQARRGKAGRGGAWRGKERTEEQKGGNEMAKTFFAGTPTRLDVQRLDDKYGVPAEDQLLTWTELAETLEISKSTYRFQTVIDAWRKKLLREHNALMVADVGSGLRRATPDARINWSSRKVAHGRRCIVRGACIAASTDHDRLTEGNKSIMSFLIDVPKRLRLMESLAMKQKEA